MRKGLTADHHEFIDDDSAPGDAEAEVKALEAEKDRLERALNEMVAEEVARERAEELKTEIEQLEAEINDKKRTRKD